MSLLIRKSVDKRQALWPLKYEAVEDLVTKAACMIKMCKIFMPMYKQRSSSWDLLLKECCFTYMLLHKIMPELTKVTCKVVFPDSLKIGAIGHV